MTAVDTRRPAALYDPIPQYVDNVEGPEQIKRECLDSAVLLEQDRQNLISLISKVVEDPHDGNSAIETLEYFILEQHRSAQHILSKLLLYVATLRSGDSYNADHVIKTIKALQILVCSKWDTDDGWHLGKAQLNALFDNRSFFYRLVGVFLVEPLKASRSTVVIIHYFYQGLLREPKIAACAFEALTQLAGPKCGFPLCRIAALRILCSIRCTSNGVVYLQHIDHSENTAAALGRTQGTSRELLNDNPRAPNSMPRILWMREDLQIIPDIPVTVVKVATGLVETDTNDANAEVLTEDALHVDKWIDVATLCVTSEEDWEIRSFALVHLGDQLRNTALFGDLKALRGIAKLRQILCSQVVQNEIQEPPHASGLKRADLALCVFDIMSSLIPYTSMGTGPAWTDRKEFGVGLVRAFLAGITGTQYDGAGRDCIHALSVCSLEFPELVVGLHPAIVTALAKNITQASLTVHILEFFSQLASIEVFRHDSRDDEVKTILGVCIQLLHRSRERDARTVEQSKSQAFLGAGPGQERAATPSREARLSESKFKRPPYRASIVKDNGLHRFASALAYHTMIVWYLATSLERRNNLASWIFRSLIYQNESNQHAIEEQGEVFLDMMLRCTRPDVNGTTPVASADDWSGDQIIEKSWMVGSSIVSLQNVVKSGLTRIVQRLASATVTSIQEPSTAISDTVNDESIAPDPRFPHIQLIDQVMPLLSKNIALPEVQAVRTSLNIFDRVATLDSYKAGVLFVGPGQSAEAEFYLNESGTPDYHRFLAQLGNEVSLKPTSDGNLPFQAHGLRYDKDGDRTIAWRDHLTEIVFLCATMMPLDQEEEEGSPWQRKKGHLGNSFATIVFNRSGQQWDFDNLKTQFNFVTIVLEPADRKASDIEASTNASLPGTTAELQSLSFRDELMPEFYQVQVLTKTDLPNISPAATPKIVSAANVARFVRMLAINGVVFSKVQESIRQGDKEFPSEWRERLQQIKALRARYGGEEAGGSSLLEQMDFKQWLEDA